MALDVRGVCPLLQVFDMPVSLAFYCDLLGFEVVESSSPLPRCNWIWLRHGVTEIMLNTAYEEEYRPPTPDLARVAAHGDTILYFGAPDVDAVYRELREKGLEIEPPKIAWYGMKQLYFKDPDGYALCFQWRAESA